MIQFKYLVYALFFQVLISVLTYSFYPKDLVLNPDKIFFNPTIYFSCSFIIVSSVLAYYYDLNCNSTFNGIIIGLVILLPFVLLTVYYHSPYEFAGKSYIAHLLTYSFSHLSGFREIVVAVLGVQSLYNFFTALNLTIFIHLFGYFIGDIVFILRRNIRYVQN